MEIILGTAMWGWSVNRDTAFHLLDDFYAAGFRKVDTATNYPINKRPKDFRFAENAIQQWANSRGISDLKVIVKIGSLSNDASPENDLTPDFIKKSVCFYKSKFGKILDSLWIHWDNRKDPNLIAETLAALRDATSTNDLGLSGIRHPDIYEAVARVAGYRFKIQVKHNMFISDLHRYEPLYNRADFYAYGINAGGLSLTNKYTASSSAILRKAKQEALKANLATIRKVLSQSKLGEFRLDTINELSFLMAAMTPKISGIIIGPSKSAQLIETLEFSRRMKDTGAKELYDIATKAITPARPTE